MAAPIHNSEYGFSATELDNKTAPPVCPIEGVARRNSPIFVAKATWISERSAYALFYAADFHPATMIIRA